MASWRPGRDPQADRQPRPRDPSRRVGWTALAGGPRRLLRTRWRRRVAAVVLVAALAGLVAVVAVATGPSTRIHEQRIEVVDGPRGDQRVSLDTTLYLPGGADASHPVPAVLLAHGFGGSKDSVRADAEDLAGHGYAVLAYSARGFGASTGDIHVNSPDYEVADARQLLDWLAERPEITKDAPGDPRVGVSGSSYGGALALMLAAHDRRIDAIAPIATWNDLSRAFFPNAAGAPSDDSAADLAPVGGPTGGSATPAVRPDDGVFKKLWAANFFANGAAAMPTPPTNGNPGQSSSPDQSGESSSSGGSATPVPSACGRFAPDYCAAFQEAARTGHASAATVALLRRSSPAPTLDRITAPTLLVQGQTDSLFPLSEADANAHGVAATGTRVKVVWFAGGHDGGSALAETDRLRGLVTDWFDHYLKGDGPAPGKAFEYTRISPPSSADTAAPRTRTFVAEEYPGLRGNRLTPDQQVIRLGGPTQTVLNPAGGTPAALSGLPGLGEISGAAGGLGGLGNDLPGQAALFQSAPLKKMVEVVGAPSALVTLTVPELSTPEPSRPRPSTPDSSTGARTGDVVLFAKLYDVDQQGRASLPQQLVAPLRVSLSDDRTATVRVTLPAIAHRFESGHRMRLAFSTTDQAYATPLDPAVYQVSLASPDLRAPRIRGVREGSGGSPIPWLVAGALVVTVVGGVATVSRIRRTRRIAAGTDPDLADVPLVIEHLGKTYGSRNARVTAVDDVSFCVERGQVVGLLGPNGAGKTTTLRMLMGLIHPSAGQVRVFGHIVRPGAPLLSRVGSFVEGPGFLPHLSGMDNLTLYWRATGKTSDAHLDEALRIAGLGSAVHRPVRTYSQGMRQRLAIAQAMLGLPDLLVLDEPTNGLDPPQIREMRGVLRDYAATGRSVLVSSHLLAEVEQTCGHVVVMNKGRVVAAGTVTDIIGDADTVRVGVDDPAAALRVVRAIAGVRAVEETESGLVVALGTARRPDIVSSLVGAGVAVDQLVPRRRLEDAFLSLVEEER